MNREQFVKTMDDAKLYDLTQGCSIFTPPWPGEKALEIQGVEKRKIGEILIEMGVADDMVIAKALSAQLKIPLVRLAETEIPEEIISLVPYDLAQKHLIIPIKKTEKGLLVAMTNPLDLSVLDDLRFVARMPIQTAIAPQKDLLEAKEKYYPPRDFKKGLDSQSGIHESIEIIQRKEEEEKDNQDVTRIFYLFSSAFLHFGRADLTA